MHLPLLVAHLERSGLQALAQAGALRDFGVLELHTDNPDALRPLLLGTGRWVEDPLPVLRRRLKPWVRWSLRERRIGLGLHLEREDGALSVHLDVMSPGAAWWLAPLHVVVDLAGWSTVRPLALRVIARRRR